MIKLAMWIALALSLPPIAMAEEMCKELEGGLPAVYEGDSQRFLKDTSVQDSRRRVFVAKLFAAGCLQSASDYYIAAGVLNHGLTTDHYFLAVWFARKAVELGDVEARELLPKTIDRYLRSVGIEQIFGTQYDVIGPFDLNDRSSMKLCRWPVSKLNARPREIYSYLGYEYEVVIVEKNFCDAKPRRLTRSVMKALLDSPLVSEAGLIRGDE